MKIEKLLWIVTAVILTLLLCSCPFPNFTTNPTDSTDPLTGSYILAGYSFSTDTPSYINIMFQVTNTDDKPVASLLTSNSR